jgi:hypothetical protein
MCVFHSSQFTFMTRNQAAQPPNAALQRRAIRIQAEKKDYLRNMLSRRQLQRLCSADAWPKRFNFAFFVSVNSLASTATSPRTMGST